MTFLLFSALCLLSSCNSSSIPYNETITLTQEQLGDKIRGGWFGQTIGCTYGGPTEFKHKGGIIPDTQPIPWYDEYIYDTFIEDPGLFDDVYMDLTFLEVMANHGIDAPASIYAESFAHADFRLWHANQAARYNILNGIGAPASGYWKNNPHADDIDFQIEADFIGMICPGMPATALELCDVVGHVMNYGDGYYGGVFAAAMYALAFVSTDIEAVIHEALRTIPRNTGFRDCIEEVLRQYKAYPNDWKQCWFEVNKKFADEIGCPDGAWNCLNIDAKLNAAYVVMGLLYGKGDFEKTMEISTRCGQDSDCNPATAAGILGVMYGYQAIPDYWKAGAEMIADMDFPYTKLSLNTTCDMNVELVKQMMDRTGNVITGRGIQFTVQEPVEAAYEQGFEGLKIVDKKVLKAHFSKSLDIPFDGTAIVAEGEVRQTGHSNLNYVARIEARIDGELVETINMPIEFATRKYDVFYRYDLPHGHHVLSLKVLNPHKDFEIFVKDIVVYDEK